MKDTDSSYNEVGSDWKRNNKPSERGAGKGKVKPYIITTSVSSMEDDSEYRRLYVRYYYS